MRVRDDRWSWRRLDGARRRPMSKGDLRMGRTLLRVMACFCVMGALGWGSAEAGQKVALRATGGRFLRAAQEGAVRADRLVPGEQETFELLPCENGRIALKAANGRFLVPADQDRPALRADSRRAEPGDRESFLLVPAGGNRTAVKAHRSGDFIVFGPTSTLAARRRRPDKPGDEQLVEIYHVAEVPPAIRSALALAIRGLVIQELADKEYDKVRTRKREEFVELPAPTLRNPRRKKKHRVLSMQEEYHLRARLDGLPEIQIVRMPWLRGYSEEGTGLVMLEVRAMVPVAGRVRYKIPDALSASTGFRTVVELAVAGQMRSEKSDDEVSLKVPEVLELRVELRRLDLSNDVLQVVRKGIEDLVNDELRKSRDRICEKANKAIRKAIEDVKVRHPLVRYLSFL